MKTSLIKPEISVDPKDIIRKSVFQNNKLHVRNLWESDTEDNLREWFCQFGRIINCKIINQSPLNRSAKTFRFCKLPG